MKRIASIAMALVLLGTLLAFAERSGWGDRITMTTTPQIIGNEIGFGGYTVSMVNEGAVAVYCLVNCNNVAEFNARYAAGTAIEIPAGDTYSFTTYGKTTVRLIYARTASGTADVLIAVY